ncbi:Uncharacterised protein [Kluyvera cryocrescens]|uniref:Uncharacterized protein n=1 Tax=Kluyvera cryocrescens TaxID=580 RepID=A0A485AEY1_KLUCR|nr:Uncharacterised protein [Kluyvera cryocrescens]
MHIISDYMKEKRPGSPAVIARNTDARISPTMIIASNTEGGIDMSKE